VTNPDVLARIDALQIKYQRALDGADMTGWLDCFGEKDASYICTTRENEEQNLPLALMMDDSYDRLKDRVRFITEVWSGTYEDYQTRHFVQRLDCADKGAGLYAVASNFMVAYTSARGRSEILAAGIYQDEISLAGNDAKFRSKKAILDTVATPRYLVYPV
jgi:anthranilate 1,2-dioxygenase small subunit